MIRGGVSISRPELQSNLRHQKNQHSIFYRPDVVPVAQRTVSALKGTASNSTDLLTPSSPVGLSSLSLTSKGSW